MNKQKVIYALSTAAFLGSAALFPALADNSTVAGNGAFSNSQVQENSQNTTQATQTNNTQANNTVTVTNNTGNNSADFNTGATVVLQSGDANAQVGISNTAGSNTAQVVGGSTGNQNTTVAGNGAFSNNTVDANSNSNTSLSQTNNTNFANTANVSNTTGNNEANFNTGGTVIIGTGNANASVGISNQAGSNQAAVSGGSGNGISGLNALVAGNGAFSSNNVSANTNSSTSLDQTNNTNIINRVTEKNNTGGNTESFNTGGFVGIFTGDANANVGISNIAGQNVGFVDGSMSGGNNSVAIIGNGAFSASNVSEWNNFRTALRQSNLTYVLNYVDTMNNTGNNAASFNTGGTTLLTTGNANASVTTFNTAGSNNGFLIGGRVFASAATAAILGNGAFSLNTVNASQNNDTSLKQDNNSMFTNTVKEKNNSGNNSGDFSTSSLAPYMIYGNFGMNTSQTGTANAHVGLYNLASANSLSY